MGLPSFETLCTIVLSDLEIWWLGYVLYMLWVWDSKLDWILSPYILTIILPTGNTKFTLRCLHLIYGFIHLTWQTSQDIWKIMSVGIGNQSTITKFYCNIKLSGVFLFFGSRIKWWLWCLSLSRLFSSKK